jgi:hypothetical protein
MKGEATCQNMNELRHIQEKSKLLCKFILYHMPDNILCSKIINDKIKF